MPRIDEPAFNGAVSSEEPSPKPGIDEGHIRPVRAVVEFEETTGFALDLMNRGGVDELPVVSPGTGKLLGIVTRRVLEEQCSGLGHDLDRCLVRSHLSIDVPYCFRDQPLDDDVLRQSGSEPVVVVDSHLQPVGFVEAHSTAAGSIVAIDPDDDSRATYSALLEQLGYAIETAATVDEVLGRLAKDPPDLVILVLLGTDDLAAATSEPDRNATTRILVVDDDPEIRNSVAGVLEKNGYGVRTEANGRVGVATAASWHPDLVLKPFTPEELLSAVEDALAAKSTGSGRISVRRPIAPGERPRIHFEAS
ncbi:MAG: hypothetical protein R6U63_01585 [Longimicrobiales bacterium]